MKSLIQRSSIFLFFLCLSANIAMAQVVYTTPAFPTETDPVTVTFDAAQGSRGLFGFTGDVYIHTGVITNLSTTTADWKYVKAAWATNLPACKMTRDAVNPNLYTVVITGGARAFYAMTNGSETAQKLAMVFRGATGTPEGKTAAGGDIFADLYSSGVLQTAFQTPANDYGVYNVNDNIPLLANASQAANLQFLLDGASVNSATAVSSLQYSLPVTAALSAGNHTVAFTAQTGTGLKDTAFYHFIIPNAALVQDAPANTKNGINYNGGGNVRLKLVAPGKSSVYVIGSFNNWTPSGAYQLKKSQNGDYFWIDLALAAGQKYTYQYFIDGQLRVADAYSEVILNSGDDPYIPAANYPNRPIYPTGKATGNVTLLELDGAADYTWQVPSFTKPDNKDLVVYELLVRDWVSKQSFQNVLDSLNYLQKLGINCIQFMPVNEFEGNLSWGYNPAFHMALDKYYGSRQMYKRLIDECHKRGIAVVMDIALNHCFSQCPLAQMYWNSATSSPAANSPWLNVTAKHDFNVGYDFNHESQYTKDYLDRVLAYWLSEFKVDGFRFDLSKGFTQVNTLGNTGAWGQYDQSRINLLNRMLTVMKQTDPTVIPILEHFADNSEETVLSNNGFLLWASGANRDYNEISMGFPADIANASSYKARGWTQSGLMSYMENHDEERLNYKNITFGAVNGAYSVRNPATALKRQEMVAALFFTVPGPKMIYQMGELGYDKSIFTCTNGTVSTTGGCRLDQKPLLWSYYSDPNRLNLFNVYKKMIGLKMSLAAFKTNNFTLSTNTTYKVVRLLDPNTNVITMANTGTAASTGVPAFPATGKWYEVFTGDSLTVTNTNMQITLQAGEYRLYTSTRVIVSTNDVPSSKFQLSAFPNPTSSETTIAYWLPETTNATVTVFNLLGAPVANLLVNVNQNEGLNTLIWNTNDVPSGTYIVRVQNATGASDVKRISVIK